MEIILVSFESLEDAQKTANHLIDNKLAACVEIYPVTNFYTWKGEKIKAQEISGVIKTSDGMFEKVKEELEKILSYETPQIIRIEASANKEYLEWMKESLKE